jgi:hypothetical protein
VRSQLLTQKPCKSISSGLKPRRALRYFERLRISYKLVTSHPTSGLGPVAIPPKPTSRPNPLQLIWVFSDNIIRVMCINSLPRLAG